MHKIVDHAERRDQIAQVACRVVAAHGFEQATIVRIARAAGYTTGMLAHYFDSKQEIILAALRLIMRRMEQRLTQPKQGSGTRLYAVLSEALPIDARRLQECAFWMAFWGQVSSDRRLKRINAWVHREYLRLYRRGLEQQWTPWGGLAPGPGAEGGRPVGHSTHGPPAGGVSGPPRQPPG